MIEPPSFAAPAVGGLSMGFRLFLWGCLVTAFLVATMDYAGAENGEQSGLRLLDAVKITIQNQPDIQLKEQDVEVSRGKLQVETGAFDTNLNANVQGSHNSRPLGSYEQLVDAPAINEVIDQNIFGVGVSKQFRNGISINPNVNVTRSEIQPIILGTSVNGPSTASTIDFEITVPLLKGRGVASTAANETAAKKNLEVSEFTMRQAISTDVLSTVQAYWDYVAARATVRQRVESEGRAQRIANDMKMLVAGGEKPASEMEQVSANLAAKTAARLSDDQVAVNARHRLGLAMGLQSEAIQALPPASDDFPDLSDKDIAYLGKIDVQLGELALQYRADYLGSKKAEEAAKVLVVAAKFNLRPQLDFTAGAGYNGVDEGRAYQRYLESLTNNVRGYNASFSLTYKWPIENNTARGNLLQKEAAYRKAVISTRDLGRNIGSNVAQAIATLRNKMSELSKYREAVNHYLNAVESEKQKNRLGISTTLDLLNTEERLTNALVNQIAAQAAFAKALVQLRHETGTLLVDRGGGISVGEGELTTIPQP